MKKILLIEDERWRYEKLADVNAQVIWASTPERAELMIKVHQLDIIMWDYDLFLPGGNATTLELAKKIDCYQRGEEWAYPGGKSEYVIVKGEPAMIVHSWNSIGANLLVGSLDKHFPTFKRTFGPECFQLLAGMGVTCDLFDMHTGETKCQK